MHITYHAAERFLQRVFNMTNYSKMHIKRAQQLLHKELSNLSSNRKRFILPSFPDFMAVTIDNSLVTIVPK